MKKLPRLRSDKSAEAFVRHADLTDFDLSEMRMAQFDFALKEQVVPKFGAINADPKRGIPAKKK